jgi:methionyl aminopeptidase
MVICIEPMIMQKSSKIQIMKDNWTVKAKDGKKTSHYEHTILIKNGFPIILTGGGI